MKIAVPLFVIGLIVVGVGLFGFERYSPINTTDAILWQFTASLIALIIGVGMSLLGSLKLLVALLVKQLKKGS